MRLKIIQIRAKNQALPKPVAGASPEAPRKCKEWGGVPWVGGPAVM